MPKRFLQYLRRCPRCELLFSPVEWLCLSCLADISTEISLKHRHIEPRIEHYYLFDWEKDDGLSPLVYSLKGGRCVWAFQFLSEYFSKMKSGRRKNLYYPSKGNEDHAFQLAKQIANLHGLTPYPIKKISENKQSLLRTGERRKILYSSPQKEWRDALVVDDIVTTGSTARACFEALGRPKNMTVWSLFYRKHL